MTYLLKHKYILILIALLGIHVCNLFIDVMEVDAAQYAAISSEMFKSKNFLEVYYHGHDYLDKPPLLFWISSFSFTLFGVSNFSYKLFAVLTLFLGIYATYRFAKIWYKESVALLSALILTSCQAYYLMSNDVRTDGLLTSWVITAVWLLTEYIQARKLKYIFLGAIATGLAMLAKGPIGLVAVGIAIGSDLLLKRKWKDIFKIQWILYFLIIGVVLLPMCYGLYTQFDLHPEKMVYDLKGPSGIRFYFWTQSFGRITGESQWNNGAPLFYFFETILWDFQPWILFLIAAIIYYLRDLFKNNLNSTLLPEYTSFCAFIFIFIMLSLSKYKLPHYIFITFPFAAILAANYLSLISQKWLNYFAGIQMVFIHIFIVALSINFIFFFPPSTIVMPLLILIILVLIWICYKKFQGIDKIVMPTLMVVLIFNLVLSLNFYPNLLKYQSTSVAGKWISENKIPPEKFYTYGTGGYALDFYSQFNVNEFDPARLDDAETGSYIYTDAAGKNNLMKQSERFTVQKELPNFHVANLKLEFLFRNMRETTLEYNYILKLK